MADGVAAVREKQKVSVVDLRPEDVDQPVEAHAQRVGDEGLTIPPKAIRVREQGIVAAAKVLTDFAKENDKRPAVKGGLFDGRAVDAAQVAKLANMPSREQMLSQLGGYMQAPMTQMVSAMNSLLSNFAGVVEALKAQREAA